MKIAIYVKGIEVKHFIVQTFLRLIGHQTQNAFIVITDKKELFSRDTPSNAEVISMRSVPINSLMQKLLWKKQLQALLKKIKADLFISIDNIPAFQLSIPQIQVIMDIKKIKHGSSKKFRLLVVTNKRTKEDLIQQHLFPEEKIRIVYPYADNMLKPVVNEKQEEIKKQYSDGSEFFLYNSSLDKQEDLVELLKAYSHFKKRQQSSFKLLMFLDPTIRFEKSLSSYKYRHDVRFIHSVSEEEHVMITGSAYAVLLPFNNCNDIKVALSSMQTGVPVIVSKDSVVKEIADEAVASPENETTKELGEQMIKLYTNENFRSQLISNGKKIIEKFTLERSADSLWEAIVSALD